MSIRSLIWGGLLCAAVSATAASFGAISPTMQSTLVSSAVADSASLETTDWRGGDALPLHIPSAPPKVDNSPPKVDDIVVAQFGAGTGLTASVLYRLSTVSLDDESKRLVSANLPNPTYQWYLSDGKGGMISAHVNATNSFYKTLFDFVHYSNARSFLHVRVTSASVAKHLDFGTLNLNAETTYTLLTLRKITGKFTVVAEGLKDGNGSASFGPSRSYWYSQGALLPNVTTL